jgi:aryl sulfotransferase
MADRALVRYRGIVYDSERWRGFRLRPDDIVISTPPKCGTTWTQMICAMLILQTPSLDTPLSVLSPWLDNVARARRDVVADLEAQQHRRFLKTHTPLDGLPLHESVTYVCVGRDPRDVALSMDKHLDNLDVDAFMRAREVAAEIDGVDPEPLPPPPARPVGDRHRFWAWVDNETPPTETGSSLLRTLRHLGSFWEAQGAVNVVMLHYDDLKSDLSGQMRALADRLGIVVRDDRWDRLVAAAGFADMRRNAENTAPNAREGMWRDSEQFFRRGVSGEWRDLLDDGDLVRYWRRVAEIAAPDLTTWVHRQPVRLA